jgi:outer membrane protein OmpA-like peptidoglycan-associated protein
MRKILFVLFVFISSATYAQTEKQLITWRFENKTSNPDLKLLTEALQSGDYTSGRITFKTRNIRLIARYFRKKEDEILFVSSSQGDCADISNANQKDILSANGKDLHRYWAFQYQKMLSRGKIDSGQFLANQKQYAKEFRRFLKGKKGKFRSVSDTNSWIVDVPDSYLQAIGNNEAVFTFIYQKQPVAVIHLDTLSGYETSNFVQVDSADCVPLDRYLTYKQQFGTTYRRADFHTYYRPHPRKIVDKEFVLQFPKNKTTYSEADIQPIINFLKANQYIIYSADITGYASVEGDSVNNQKLQKRRAEVLVSLLEKNNTDSIEVTLNTFENWDEFYRQIENTPYAIWKGKSREETKKWLENDSVEVLMEPLLSPERKAVLRLKVAEKLTTLQKQVITKEDYEKAIAKIRNPDSPKDYVAALRKAASIRNYLKENLRKDSKQAVDCGDILKNTTSELAIIDFYEAVSDFRKGKEPVCMTLQEIVIKAFFASSSLIRDADDSKLMAIYTAQAIDIQNFTFEQMLNKKFPATMLCQIFYPDEPRFRDLYMSRLAFESQEGKFIFAEAACPKEAIPAGVSRLYYRLLRDIVFNDKNATEFDIYELLYYSVLNFDEKRRIFYDNEVNDKVMLKYLQKLTATSKRLCPIQYNQLVIDFYLKNAYYQAFNPALKRIDRVKQVTSNLGNVKKYYLERMAKTEEKQLLRLAQLYVFYGAVLNERIFLESAAEILKKEIDTTIPSFETIRYYLQIAVFLPDKESVVQKLLRYTGKLSDKQWCSLFTGKQSISLQGEDLQELRKRFCEKCR